MILFKFGENFGYFAREKGFFKVLKNNFKKTIERLNTFLEVSEGIGKETFFWEDFLFVKWEFLVRKMSKK